MRSALVILTALGMIVVAFSVCEAQRPVDREKLFKKLRQNKHQDTKLTISEFLSMARGRHSPQVKSALIKQFYAKDSLFKDGMLSVAEFKKNPTSDDQLKGEVIFPSSNAIVDVDEFMEEFEVMIIPPLPGMMTEYMYYAKSYTLTQFPAMLPDDPTTIQGAYAIDNDAGMYRYGWISEPDHKEMKPLMQKKLVIWEGTQEFDPCTGLGKGWEWSKDETEIIDFYPHTSNLFPIP